MKQGTYLIKDTSNNKLLFFIEVTETYIQDTYSRPNILDLFEGD